MNIVFIVGTGRCGSTLVNDVVAAHEEVGFVSEAEERWLPGSLKGRFYRALDKMRLLRLVGNERGRRFPSEAYRLIAREVSPIYVRPSRDLEASDVTPWLERRFRKFFFERFERQSKPVFVHKYTGWSRIGFLSKIFPEARFIHIIRDGRAVANSWLQIPWWDGYKGPNNWLWGDIPNPYRKEWQESNYSYIVLAGIGWKILMDAYESASKNIDSKKYLTVQYEDFITNPREVMADILSFIGLEWTRGFEKHFIKKEIRTSRSRAFERDLTPGQLSQLQSSLSKKLIQYRYLDQ